MKLSHDFVLFFPTDLSGKMFTFPLETNTAHVRLNTAKQDFGAVTVCHRYSQMVLNV